MTGNKAIGIVMAIVLAAGLVPMPAFASDPWLPLSTAAGAGEHSLIASNYDDDEEGEGYDDEDDPEDLSSGWIELDKERYEYTGREIRPNPVVTIEDWYYYDDEELIRDVDYTVTYRNNVEIGKATVIVQGIGDYTGTLKATFKIVPPQPKAPTVKSKKIGTVKATVKKTSGAQKYQFLASTSKSTSSGKKAVSSKRSHTFKKLTQGKKYYVRVRAGAVAGGKTYYSSWSKPAAIKVKAHPFVGTWKLSSMYSNGTVTGASDLKALKEYGLTVKLYMYGNGKGSLDLFGDTTSLTWKAASKTKGSARMQGQTVLLTYANKKLTMSQDGASLTFKK